MTQESTNMANSKEAVINTATQEPVFVNPLVNLQEGFKETSIIYERMKRFIEFNDKQREYYDAKSSWIERLKNERFPIAFLGTFSSGKSTIINALIARDILPESVKSLTAIPTALIKSGDEDEKAIIYYLSEDQKNELKTILLEEITNKLGKNITDYNKLNKDDLILKLKSEIEKLPNQETFDLKLFNELKQLLEKWDKSKAGEIKEIPLTELHKYVTEDYEDVLLVDKCEVRLNTIDIPEDLILVDLPGLKVVNPRHKKVTRDYVEKSAKAFVVCMMPKQLLEGEEIQTLEEIQNVNPRILQKAFWVVNQWDTLNDHQKSEEKDNFQNKVREKKFDIDQDRVFYVSALNYLLLKAVIEGWLDETIKLKSHVKNIHAINAGRLPDTDKARDLLEVNPDVSNFESFKASLFDYMNKKARKEFIQDAQFELLKFIRELTNILAPLYEEESDTGENLESRLQSKYLVQKLETYSKKVKDIIENGIKKVRVEAPENRIAWTEKQKNQVVSIIEEKISRIDKVDLKNQLMKGVEADIYMSRLLERLTFLVPVSNILREEVNEYFMKTIIDKLCQTLRLELIGLNQQALPNQAKERLESKLNGRDFATRLKGLNDYIFYEYGKKVEIGLTEAILNLDKKDDNLTKKGIDNQIDMVIEKFKKIAIDFTDKTVDSINIYSNRCVKNFVEELEKELLELFTNYKDDIASKLDLEIKRDDTQLSKEIEKQKFINTSYKRLKELELSVYQ